MPAGLDNHLRGAGLQAGEKVGFVPTPHTFADSFAISLLTALDRIVNETQVTATPGNA